LYIQLKNFNIVSKSKSHKHLLEIYKSSLNAVNGQTTVAAYLREHHLEKPLALIAIGKAAAQMAKGAFEVLNSEISQALLITKYGHLENLKSYPILCLEAAHPVPDVSSLIAGQTLLNFIKNLPSTYPILFLISGGTSALVEVLSPGVTLTDLQQINNQLLASGLEIKAMNKVRKNLSAIKGGGLATYLEGHPVLNLLISDVPKDDLEVIGSGLLTQSSFKNIKQEIIANPTMARQAACEAAKRLGYKVFEQQELIVGESEIVGHSLGKKLCQAKMGIYIASSETTVHLPENTGQGGRCQSLALAAACELAGKTDVFFLAAGTDGTDGPGKFAGAIVDGNTLTRCHFDAKQYLKRADAGSFLKSSGDLIETGPTGTNVMDILIGLKL
jgi:hydroxypyruvate reductase